MSVDYDSIKLPIITWFYLRIPFLFRHNSLWKNPQFYSFSVLILLSLTSILVSLSSCSTFDVGETFLIAHCKSTNFIRNNYYICITMNIISFNNKKKNCASFLDSYIIIFLLIFCYFYKYFFEHILGLIILLFCLLRVTCESIILITDANKTSICVKISQLLELIVVASSNDQQSWHMIIYDRNEYIWKTMFSNF